MKKDIDPKAFYNERMPEKLGADYEHARWHSNTFQEAQYAMMQRVMKRYVMPFIRSAKTVLEIGPGAGTWTKFLLKANPEAEYTLVDISTEMLARARANLPQETPVVFIESDVLSFEPRTQFDVVFSSRALEYMPDKPAAVRKIASLVRPGGTALIITKMPKAFAERISGRKPSDFHAGRIAPAELISLFQKEHFTLIALRMATSTVPGFQSVFLNRLFFSIFSHVPLLSPLGIFAESYIAVLKKAT